MRPTPKALRGIALLVASMQIVPINDMIVKVLDARYPPFQQVFGRLASQLLVMTPLALYWHGHRALLRQPHWRLLHARGAANALAAVLFYSALKYMPLAVDDASAEAK